MKKIMYTQVCFLNMNRMLWKGTIKQETALTNLKKRVQKIQYLINKSCFKENRKKKMGGEGIRKVI